jgi:hypothetical protein
MNEHLKMCLDYLEANEFNHFCEWNDLEFDDLPDDHEFTDEQKDHIYYHVFMARRHLKELQK